MFLENNYYPFGLKHKGYNGFVSTEGNDAAQRWKFGGKEYQQDMDLNWYDVSARNYDPALGRWMNIDPLADKMRRHSPYNYAFDNPIYFIDADGMAPTEVSNGYTTMSTDEADAAGIEYSGVEGTVDITHTDSNGKTTTVTMSTGVVNSTILAAGGGSNSKKGSGGKGTGCETGDCFARYFKAKADEIQGQLDAMKSGEDKKTQYYAVNQFFSTYSAFTSLSSIVYSLDSGDVNLMGKIYDNYAIGNRGRSYYMHNPNKQFDEARRMYNQNKVGNTKLGNGLSYLSMGYSIYSYASNPNYGYSFGGSDMKYAKEAELVMDLAMTRLGMSPNPYAIGTSLFYFWIAKPAAARTERSIEKNYNGDRKAWRARMMGSDSYGICFIAGTKILMNDGSQKNIENVNVGDYVKTFNLVKGEMEISKVLKMDSPMHDDLVEISFDNEISNTNTKDHPYYVKGKGWSSFDPDLTLKNYNLRVRKLIVGDICYQLVEDELMEIKVAEILEIKEERRTYNLSDVERNNNFFANGVLVHNKK